MWGVQWLRRGSNIRRACSKFQSDSRFLSLLLTPVFSPSTPPCLTHVRGAAGFTWDYVFDWTILKYAQQQNSRPSTSRPADGAFAAPQPRAQEDARDAEAALRRLGLQ